MRLAPWLDTPGWDKTAVIPPLEKQSGEGNMRREWDSSKAEVDVHHFSDHFDGDPTESTAAGAVTPSATTPQPLGRHPDCGTFPGQDLVWESNTKLAEMGLSISSGARGWERGWSRWWLFCLLVLRSSEHPHPFLHPSPVICGWGLPLVSWLSLKWEVFLMWLLKMWAKSCLLYQLSPSISVQVAIQPICSGSLWVFHLALFLLLVLFTLETAPKYQSIWNDTSLIIILNDQTVVETHHCNCVCLLHWLFLVNLFLAFVSGWQIC